MTPEDVPVITYLRWFLSGIGVAAALISPRIAAEADFGSWSFAVTAVGSHEFREVYTFRSRRACEEQRNLMQQSVSRVLMEHGDTAFGGLARRLRLSPCEVIRLDR